MKEQREFMSETFHLLAQPITALRITVEMGLTKARNGTASHQTLEECLCLIDRLMQDLAIFREISSLDERPALHACDGRAALERCVEEMALVAQDRGIALHLSAEPANIQCDEPTLHRAVFVLLDEMIARAPSDGQIAICLRKCRDGFLLEFCPGIPPGQRQKLCRKLMQFAGGSSIRLVPGSTSMILRKCSYRQLPAISLIDKQVLTPPSPSPGNRAGRTIS